MKNFYRIIAESSAQTIAAGCILNIISDKIAVDVIDVNIIQTFKRSIADGTADAAVSDGRINIVVNKIAGNILDGQR